MKNVSFATDTPGLRTTEYFAPVTPRYQWSIHGFIILHKKITVFFSKNDHFFFLRIKISFNVMRIDLRFKIIGITANTVVQCTRRVQNNSSVF